jgi:putative transposase
MFRAVRAIRAPLGARRSNRRRPNIAESSGSRGQGPITDLFSVAGRNFRRFRPTTKYRRIKMPRRRSQQLDLPAPRTWGGRRSGAGRKPDRDRAGTPHVRRPPHDARHPVHVTFRAGRGVPWLRSQPLWAALRDALREANRTSFRVVHFSVQSDHLHLIVEADSARVLCSGLRGLAIRSARAVNRCCARRGSVWAERYHARALRTPREVRLALTYVLLNFCKHLRAKPGVDPRSSARWFDGWKHPQPNATDPCPTMPPQTWLCARGWRRAGGPIDFREAPLLRTNRA